MVARVGGRIGVRLDLDSAHELAHRRIVRGAVLEMIDDDAALEQRAGEAVLDAELRVEITARIGPVYVREAARMYARCTRSTSPCKWRRARRARSCRRSRHARCRSRIELDAEPRTFDVEGLAHSSNIASCRTSRHR